MSGNLSRMYLPVGALLVVAIVLAIVFLTPFRGVVGLATGAPSCTDYTFETDVTGNISSDNLFDCYYIIAQQGDKLEVQLTTPDGTLDADFFKPDDSVNSNGTNGGFTWLTGPKGSSGKKELSLPWYDSDMPVNSAVKFVVKVWSYKHLDKGSYTLNVKSLGVGTELANQEAPKEAKSQESTASTDWEKCLAADTVNPVSGSINSADPFDCYILDLQSGQKFTVTYKSDNITEKTPNGIALDLDILGPSKTVTGEASNAGTQYLFTASTQNKTFSADSGEGEYKVKAWSYGNKNQGKYELSISLESVSTSGQNQGQISTTSGSGDDKTCSDIDSDKTVEGSVLSNNVYDCYTFDGSKGDEITITLESPSKKALDADLFTPGGTISTSPSNTGFIWVTSQGSETKTFTLTGDGKYTVKAWSYGNMSTGPYKLTVKYPQVVKAQESAPSQAPVVSNPVANQGQSSATTPQASTQPPPAKPAVVVSEKDSCGNEVAPDATKVLPTGCDKPDFANGVYGIVETSYDSAAKNFAKMSDLSELIDGIIVSGSWGKGGHLRYASLFQEDGTKIAGNDLDHCSDGYTQHQMYRSFDEIGDASKQSYPVSGLDSFRTYTPSTDLNDPCYSGMFLFRQGDRYGAVQLLSNYQAPELVANNTPWTSGTMGRVRVKAWDQFIIGFGKKMSWGDPDFNNQKGSIYADNILFANVGKGSCGGSDADLDSYAGFSSFEDLKNVSSLIYSETNVNFCTLAHTGTGSNDGLLVFKLKVEGDQLDDIYGVMQFTRIMPDGSMVLDWWLGNKEVTDFSRAPTDQYISKEGIVPTEFDNPPPFVWGSKVDSKAYFKFWLANPGVTSFADADTWPVYESTKWPLSLADRQPDPDRKPIMYTGQDTHEKYTYYCPWHSIDCEDGIGVYNIGGKPEVARAVYSYGSDRTAESVLKEISDAGLIIGNNDYHGGLTFVYRRPPVAVGKMEPVIIAAHWSDSLSGDETGDRLAKVISPELTSEFFKQGSYGKFSFDLKGENIYWLDLGKNERDKNGQCNKVEKLAGRHIFYWNLYRLKSEGGKLVKDPISEKEILDLGYGNPYAVFEYAKECATAETSGGNYGSIVSPRWTLDSNVGIVRLHDLWWSHNRSGESVRRTEIDPFTQDQHTWIHEWLHGLNIDYHENALLCDKSYVLLSQCENVEYGSQFSIMGNGYAAKTPGAPIRYALGWLDGDEILHINKPGTYTIKPLNSTSGKRAVAIDGAKLVPGGGIIWLEYRRPSPVDNALTNSKYLSNTQGLIIHAGGLIDARPEYDESDRYRNDLDEVSLNSGSWKDINTGVKIYNVDPNGDEGITFDVAFEDPAECIRGKPYLTNGLYSNYHHFVLYDGGDWGPYWRTNPALPDSGQCGSNWIIATVSEMTEPNGNRTITDFSEFCKSHKKEDGSWRVLMNKLLIKESNGGWCHSSAPRWSVEGSSGLPYNWFEIGAGWKYKTQPFLAGGDLQFTVDIPEGSAPGQYMLKMKFMNIISNEYDEFLLPVFVGQEFIGDPYTGGPAKDVRQPTWINAVPLPEGPPSELTISDSATVVGKFGDDVLKPGERVFYYLDGADRELFMVSDAGEISFKSAPSFAAPTDTGKDNTYDLDITRTIIPAKDHFKIETLAKSFKISVQSN